MERATLALGLLGRRELHEDAAPAAERRGVCGHEARAAGRRAAVQRPRRPAAGLRRGVLLGRGVPRGDGGGRLSLLLRPAGAGGLRGAVRKRSRSLCVVFEASKGAAAQASKPSLRLWESEAHDGLWDRALVTSYNNARKTAEIDWCAIWSACESSNGLPHHLATRSSDVRSLPPTDYPEFVDGGSALFWAFEPWSGHYIVDAQPGGISQLWKSAHFTQFTQPGWRYLDGAHGNLSAAGGGAYLALTSDGNGSDVSIMIQTHSNYSCIAAGAAPNQTAVLSFVGSWCPSGCDLQLWTSNTTQDFIHSPSLHLPAFTGSTRNLTLNLAATTIYTLSTIKTARKGSHPPPPPRLPFPFPFTTDFEAANDTLPKYISDNSGSFSIENGAGKGGGSALKQRVTMNPDVGNGWINVSTADGRFSDGFARGSLADESTLAALRIRTP
eukprot:COSAG04_NODE_655_length_11510_cov_33.080887_1_plen_441_part_00